MIQIQKLLVYPVKSLMGISIPVINIEKRGLQNDRRWMLIDPNGKFISQRSHPILSRVQVVLKNGNFRFTYLDGLNQQLEVKAIPLEKGPLLDTEVWGAHSKALPVSPIADQWFTTLLQLECRLVYMPDSANRLVNPKYASPGDIVSFADGYPLLAIGQASLDDLNERLAVPVGMDRFRPNIVFSGDEAFGEDNWDEVQINNLYFRGIKPCARCIIPTIDQTNGQKSGPEPIKTLSDYRKRNNKIYFGMNLIWQHQKHDQGMLQLLKVGDSIQVNSRMKEIIFT